MRGDITKLAVPARVYFSILVGGGGAGWMTSSGKGTEWSINKSTAFASALAYLLKQEHKIIRNGITKARQVMVGDHDDKIIPWSSTRNTKHKTENREMTKGC